MYKRRAICQHMLSDVQRLGQVARQQREWCKASEDFATPNSCKWGMTNKRGVRDGWMGERAARDRKGRNFLTLILLLVANRLVLCKWTYNVLCAARANDNELAILLYLIRFVQKLINQIIFICHNRSHESHTGYWEDIDSTWMCSYYVH